MLLRHKTKTNSLTMMFMPHYDSPVRIIRLPFAALYAILVVVVMASIMLGQLVFRYNQMQANIETLRQGSSRRLVDLQREMLYDYSNRLNNIQNKFAVVEEYLNYLSNLNKEVKASVAVVTPNNTLEQVIAENSLKQEFVPKPAAYLPVTYDNLQKTSEHIIKESDERTRALSVMNAYAQEYKDLRDRTPTGWPLQGRLTSFFGWREWTGSFHEGIDIVAPLGTPLHATASGTVIRAEWFSGYGLCVDILHRDGIVTRYGHCDKILVKKGDGIKIGQVIALTGSTGNSDIPHCHYEIRINDKSVDPMKFPF